MVGLLQPQEDAADEGAVRAVCWTTVVHLVLPRTAQGPVTSSHVNLASRTLLQQLAVEALLHVLQLLLYDNPLAG